MPQRWLASGSLFHSSTGPLCRWKVVWCSKDRSTITSGRPGYRMRSSTLGRVGYCLLSVGHILLSSCTSGTLICLYQPKVSSDSIWRTERLPFLHSEMPVDLMLHAMSDSYSRICQRGNSDRRRCGRRASVRSVRSMLLSCHLPLRRHSGQQPLSRVEQKNGVAIYRVGYSCRDTS